MNLFCQCGNNSCLWILILLLLAASCNGKCNGILDGACLPVLIALIYTMWKNGTLSNIFCGNGCNNGCGCN